MQEDVITLSGVMVLKSMETSMPITFSRWSNSFSFITFEYAVPLSVNLSPYGGVLE